MRRTTIALLAILLLAACQPIQPISPDAGTDPAATEAAIEQDGSAFAGEWRGVIEVANLSLRVLVELVEDADGWTGTIDVPAQGATDIPLHTFAVNGDTISMQMLEGAPLGEFNGTLSPDGTISGAFTQGGMEGTFSLARPVDTAVVEPSYVVEEISFPSGDAVLAGTLTRPEGSGPFPAIVLVSGSGPQNRDEELPVLVDYAPFREIADRLTQSGFAVLRYDDRGVGESTGDFASATTTTFADDARAAIDWSRALPEVDPAQVGILGHSEGANVAAMVGASNPSLPYIVAWAGTAVPGDELLVHQNVLQMEKAGGLPEDVARYREEYAQAVAFAIADDEQGLRDYLDTVVRTAFEQLSDEEKAGLGDMEDAVAQQVEGLVGALFNPWMSEFLLHNPADDWAQVTSPVLAFFGGLDTQVDPAQNRSPMVDALTEAGNADVSVETIPAANHLFLTADTGAVSEYAGLSPALIPEFLDKLTAWLVAHASFVQ